MEYIIETKELVKQFPGKLAVDHISMHVLAEFIYEEAEKNFKGMKIRTDLTDGDRAKEENFAMVYRTWCPATLTENFFQDNADDVRYILSDEGRAAVIKTHVDGIINYVKSL